MVAELELNSVNTTAGHERRGNNFYRLTAIEMIPSRLLNSKSRDSGRTQAIGNSVNRFKKLKTR